MSFIHTINKSEAFSNVIININHGLLISLISGGSQQTIRIGEKLELDGSKSYDEDIPNLTGSEIFSIFYEWSCLQFVH